MLQLLAVAAMASAAQRLSPLDVQLEQFNGTTITAIVTNTGTRTYNLLHRNSILDIDPSRKLHIFGHDHGDLRFHGIHKHNCADGAHQGPKDFTRLAAGQKLYRDIDIAGMYDLDVETYDILAEGSLPYADESSLWLSGNAVPFRSNILELPVLSAQTLNTAEKANDLRMKRKRTTIDSSCTSDQNARITSANQGCVKLAEAAANAALTGSAERFAEYFKDSSDATRQKVADVYNSVAKECAATPGGTSTSHCTDPYNYCSGNLIAYTYWSTWGSEKTRDVYYCPRYFDVMPEASSMCHSQSQASNTLHEMTHAMAETDDYAYGYDGIMTLGAEHAVANADTYALYASDLDMGCGDYSDSSSDDSSWGDSGYGDGTTDSGWEGSSKGSPAPTSPSDSSDNQTPPSSSGSDSQGNPEDCPPEQAPQNTQGQGPSNGGIYSWDDLMNWLKNYRWGQSSRGRYGGQ